MKTPHRGSFLFGSEKVRLTQHFVIPRELPGYILYVVFSLHGFKTPTKRTLNSIENIDKMKSGDILPETNSLHLQSKPYPKKETTVNRIPTIDAF